MTPAKPHKSWFISLDSTITKFLWKSKPPRISLKTLQNTKDKDGLDLPNFNYYVLANRLKSIINWTKQNELDHAWFDIEQSISDEILLQDLPYTSTIIKHHICFNSISISTVLSAWWEFLKINKTQIMTCPKTPNA